MLQADKRQQKHIEKMLCEDSDLMYVLDNGIRVDSYISFDTMAKIVDYLRTADKKDDLFEECWKEYRRKGSKGKSKQYWYKLTDDEKELVLPHIKAYVSSRDVNYQKDFERYLRDKIFNDVVYKGGDMIYDPSKGASNEYNPIVGGNLVWNDYFKKFIFLGMFTDQIYDGYDDDGRPDGAEVMLNNGRGTIKWNKEHKEWIQAK